MQIYFSRPRSRVRLHQILPLIAVGLLATACGSDKTQNYNPASTPNAASGAELYAEQ